MGQSGKNKLLLSWHHSFAFAWVTSDHLSKHKNVLYTHIANAIQQQNVIFPHDHFKDHKPPPERFVGITLNTLFVKSTECVTQKM